MSKGFDPRCGELAEYFLHSNCPQDFTQEEISSLAQDIQDAVEDWFLAMEEDDPKGPANPDSPAVQKPSKGDQEEGNTDE